MARSLICGFEMGHLDECYLTSGTVSISSSIKRTGSYSLRSNPASGTGYAKFLYVLPGGASSRTFSKSFRVYIYFASMPTGTGAALTIGRIRYVVDPDFDYATLNISGSGHATPGRLSVGSGALGSTTLTTGLWYRIEMDVGYVGGGGFRLYLDGVQEATFNINGPITAADTIELGCISSTTADIYFDDLLVDDDTFATTGFPGAGQVILLPPVSDNTDGTWLAGAGGTSLFDAVDNFPPAGAATPTNTSQIKNASKGTNDGLINCRTYTDGGVGASDTINAVMGICADGEAIATGTKTGGIWVNSNPVQSAPGNTFDYGDNVGALNGYPTNWATHVGPVAVAPSVTKGSSPVIGFRKYENTTREGHICFLGVYVDYTPPGFTAVSDTQIAYLKALEALTQTRASYLKALEALTQTKVAYLFGHEAATGTRAAYLAALEAVLQGQASYLKAHEVAAQSQSAYLQALEALSGAKPAYLLGHEAVTGQKPAFLLGHEAASDSQPSYLYGLESTSEIVSAFLRALETASLGVVSYLNSVEGIPAVKPAYLAGMEALAAQVASYLASVEGINQLRPSFLNATEGVTGGYPSFLWMHEALAASKAAFLEASTFVPASQSKTAYLASLETIASTVPAYVAAREAEDGQKPAYLLAHEAATQGKAAYLASHESVPGAVQAFVRGSESLAAAVGAYLASLEPLSAAKSAFLSGSGGEGVTGTLPSYQQNVDGTTRSLPSFQWSSEPLALPLAAYLFASLPQTGRLKAYLRMEDRIDPVLAMMETARRVQGA